MGERFDYLMRLTMFNIECPECGEHGKGWWADRPHDIVRCTRCGARFKAHENTWRPVTGGMDDDERREYYLEQNRLRMRGYAEDPGWRELTNRKRAERRKVLYHSDERYRQHVLELGRLRCSRWRARERKKRHDRTLRVWKETKMGKKDTLGDLQDHLFAELERLGDESLTTEQLETEIARAKAISGIAQSVISNANVALKAAMFQDDRMDANGRLPRMLTDGDA